MFEQKTNDALAESTSARALLQKAPGRLIANVANALPGDYLSNYSQCLLNRQIDIFDDAKFLLDNNRIPSACAISRAMIETYAIAKLLGTTIESALNKNQGRASADDCLAITLRFTNSSRFKETEQKKMANGIFSPNDYKFTKQASERMLKLLATSEHVMNALRALYKEEMTNTGKLESLFELIYDGLSEWVHPSQTSIFHNYVPDTHLVPTSAGETYLHDTARLLCIRALHFITQASLIHAWLVALSNEIDMRAQSQ